MTQKNEIKILAPTKTCEVLTPTANLTHDEWLEFRRQGIGGSDASAIVGLNPWSSAHTVFADKLGFTPPTEENEAMRIGHDLEPYVAERFCEETGKRVRRLNAILRSVEHPFMLANVDRMLIGERAGLECKTTSPYSKYDWEDGNVPGTYYCQCQHYMSVVGLDRWYLAVLVLGKAFYWYEVERNEADINALVQAEREFWENHVLAKTPPEPDGSAACGDVIKGMYKGDTGGEVMLTGVIDDLNRYDVIKGMMDSLEREKKEIEQRLQTKIGDAHVGIADGWKISWKPSTTTRLDTKRIKEERPDLYETFSKSSVSRRFTVKKEAS